MPPDLAIIPWADQPLAGLYRLIAAAIFSKRKYAETISFTPFYRGTRHNNSRISPADPPAHGASGTFPSCGHSTGRTISPMRLCLDGLSQLARPTVSSRVRLAAAAVADCPSYRERLDVAAVHTAVIIYISAGVGGGEFNKEGFDV